MGLANGVPIGEVTSPVAFNQDLRAIQPPKTVIPRFLLLALRNELLSERGEGVLSSAAHGTLKIDADKLRQISFPVPPIAEQRRIVGILDEAFEGIATAKANAEQNLRNSRAIFTSHLHAVFDDAWSTNELVALSDLALSITDGDHMPPPKSPTGIPFITIGNILKETREIDFSDTFKVPQDYFDALKSSRKPQLGDVLYTVTGSFGIPVLIRGSAEFCFQRHIALIRPKPEVRSDWLYYLLLSPQVVAQGEAGATGAAQRTVSLSLLRGFLAPKVAGEAQQRVVKQLDALSAETQLLARLHEQKLLALESLKRSLLHKAFTGQL